jgi:outer membrane protein assembly factor BamA
MRHVLLLGFLSALTVGAVAQDVPTTYTVTRIDATGLQRFTTADVIRVSGLAVGRSVSAKDVERTAAAMAETGLFRAVRYRFASDTGGIAITFEIDEEKDWSVPVVYDNFIWIDDAELNAAVREAVPAFAGTAPANSRVPDLIVGALSNVLRGHNIAGEVSYTPRTRLDGTGRKHIFAVTNPAPALCALHVDGAVRLREADLVQTAHDAIAKPYSRQYVAEFASKTLVQAYHDRGYWRAAFQPPAATPGDVGSCHGAIVTVRVDEGVPYRFQRTNWIGNHGLSRTELDNLLGLPADALAEETTLTHGLEAIAAAYRTRGYLNQTATPKPVFDEDTRHVSFEVTIDEGAQFHMGIFSTDGVPAPLGDTLAKKWKLQAGDVFDASYPGTFVKLQLAGRVQDGRPLVLFTSVNQTARVVDVMVGVRK